ncbi:hypothetical protein DFH08DRAFT_799552 [Mycena albidolilacea]|uniref:Uncharacterized protein n=1 Tax=Mycena albidolilacea TaxID=1033008 RepID=A0AAD7ALV0_9AGAR|nr:hypothetical protein DFH08DRAFT_799552 [Mycena albidolilacea]
MAWLQTLAAAVPLARSGLSQLEAQALTLCCSGIELGIGLNCLPVSSTATCPSDRKKYTCQFTLPLLSDSIGIGCVLAPIPSTTANAVVMEKFGSDNPNRTPSSGFRFREIQDFAECVRTPNPGRVVGVLTTFRRRLDSVAEGGQLFESELFFR